MNSAQLTEERLRCWLDSNQVQRERMCLALLSLNRKYSNIKPRRPKGGPDGSRDIEAVYDERYDIWGAVGFRNSANDSPEDKKWVKNKLIDDLNNALQQKSDLQGFVFFTNVDLTPLEEVELRNLVISKGPVIVEIFYRERLRILLDSPAGLGLRYQYLGIPLSEAEQAAFFERFGTELETLMLKQFDSVDKRLARIEFFHDCTKPITDCRFKIILKNEYTADSLGHYRILFEVINMLETDPHPTIWFGGRDAYPIWHRGGSETKLFATKSIVWSQNPNHDIQNTIVGASMSTNSIEIFGQTYKKGPFLTIGDFDRKTVSLYVTKPLFEMIKEISFIIDDYVLLAFDLDEINPENESPLTSWPEELTVEEQKIPWISIFSFGGFDFSAYTPNRVEKSE